MPFSSTEGKPWIVDRIRELEPASILDVGPGAGTYARLLRPILPSGARIHALEIHAPYVERFGLADVYDEIQIGDARTAKFPRLDVIILGDVIEHMSLDDAKTVWFKARGAAKKAVILSLPIVPYPQGEWEGNTHEAHLHTWDHDMVVRELDGIKVWETYSEIGVYLA